MRHIYITQGRLEQLSRYSGRKEAMFEVETVEKFPDDVRVNLLTDDELKEEMRKVWNAAHKDFDGMVTRWPDFESYWQERMKEGGK